MAVTALLVLALALSAFAVAPAKESRDEHGGTYTGTGNTKTCEVATSPGKPKSDTYAKPFTKLDKLTGAGGVEGRLATPQPQTGVAIPFG